MNTVWLSDETGDPVDDDDEEAVEVSTDEAFYLHDDAETLFKFRRNLSIELNLRQFDHYPVHLHINTELHPAKPSSLGIRLNHSLCFASVSFSELSAEKYGQDYIRLQPTYQFTSSLRSSNRRQALIDTTSCPHDACPPRPISDNRKRSLDEASYATSRGETKRRKCESFVESDSSLIYENRGINNHGENIINTLPELGAFNQHDHHLDPLSRVIRDLELRLSRQGGLADPLSYLGKHDNNKYDIDDPMFDDEEMVREYFFIDNI